MVVRRWRQRAGPALIALVVIGLFGSRPVGAGEIAWAPPACADDPAGGGGPTTPVTPDAAGRTWYRVAPRLDGAGAQVAQRVSLGSPGGGPVRVVELAAESFVAGPWGTSVLTGSDDGRLSTLRLLDLGAGCARTVGTERAVVRRATLDRAGTAIYEFRVDRRTRADLGVWRRPLDGSTTPRRVLQPLDRDPRFGRTFSTELSWSVEGDRLVVQSCGAFACRTRIWDPTARTSVLVDEPDLGELVGLAADRLVTYQACRGLPCPVVSVELASRARMTLSEEAGLAVLVDAGSGARLVHEDDARGQRLRIVDLAGQEQARIPAPAGYRLVPTAARALAGAAVPPGWLALAPAGRDWPDAGPDRLLRPARAGAAAPFEEVLR